MKSGFLRVGLKIFDAAGRPKPGLSQVFSGKVMQSQGFPGVLLVSRPKKTSRKLQNRNAILRLGLKISEPPDGENLGLNQIFCGNPIKSQGLTRVKVGFEATRISRKIKKGNLGFYQVNTR